MNDLPGKFITACKLIEPLPEFRTDGSFIARQPPAGVGIYKRKKISYILRDGLPESAFGSDRFLGHNQ